ncbi:MAG TPA: hypothetical protein VMH87_18920 [Pseudomonadales bacterium]|nr:hypothetical protein [Pseudomonadales bacterium]
MKILYTQRRRETAQILVEACIGLSLMVFTWILLSYSLYMANNKIRTEMAARYAAWYTGNNNGTMPAASQIDQYFFFQSNLSTVTNETPDNMSTFISQLSGGLIPSEFTSFLNLSDGTSANGPFRVQVTYGVTDPSSSGNPFPFSILQTHVPFMTNSMMSIYSVNSTCQWDGDSDTWNTASQAWGLLTTFVGNMFGSFASAIGDLFN